jgi:hypothetical protein
MARQSGRFPVSKHCFPDYKGHVTLQHRRLNRDGYDRYGVYYGNGQRLYYIAALSADGMDYIFEDEFRAIDRQDAINQAKDIFPNGKFTGAKK